MTCPETTTLPPITLPVALTTPVIPRPDVEKVAMFGVPLTPTTTLAFADPILTLL